MLCEIYTNVQEGGERKLLAKLSNPNADEDRIIESLNLRRGIGVPIPEFLRAVFANQGEIADFFVNPDEKAAYHANDRDMDPNTCSGFRALLLKAFGASTWETMTDAGLERVQDAITTKLEIIAKMLDSTETRTLASTRLISFVAEKSGAPRLELIPPVLTSNPILLTGDKAYKLEMVEAEGIQSLKDITTQAALAAKGVYEATLNAKVSVLNSEISSLKDGIKKAVTNAFVEGIKTFDKLKNDWFVNDKGMIEYKNVIGGESYKENGKIYKLPATLSKKFFIKGLQVQITDMVQTATCTESHHLNADNHGVCMGDLENADLVTVLKKLPESLKVMNADSSFGGEPEIDIRHALYGYQEEGKTHKGIFDKLKETETVVWTSRGGDDE